ncbi:hypothetical protein ABZ714_32885 [Streptomyces sp. NPDC006798]
MSWSGEREIVVGVPDGHSGNSAAGRSGDAGARNTGSGSGSGSGHTN